MKEVAGLLSPFNHFSMNLSHVLSPDVLYASYSAVLRSMMWELRVMYTHASWTGRRSHTCSRWARSFWEIVKKTQRCSDRQDQSLLQGFPLAAKPGLMEIQEVSVVGPSEG
jgi:hypothetical protein